MNWTAYRKRLGMLLALWLVSTAALAEPTTITVAVKGKTAPATAISLGITDLSTIKAETIGRKATESSTLVISVSAPATEKLALFKGTGTPPEVCSYWDLPAAHQPLEIALENMLCDDGTTFNAGGLLLLTDGTKYQALISLTDQTLAAKLAESQYKDFGIALNVMDRGGDDEKYRHFQGASIYYALNDLNSSKFRFIANLALLDFDEEVDLETGIGFGFLYRANNSDDPSAGSFTISFVRGYNLMVDGSGAYYNMIGFGWSFGTGSN